MSKTNTDNRTAPASAGSTGYPSVEPDGDGYIVRLDDGDNWHYLTKPEAKQLCTALLEDGPGAAKHLLQVTIG